jgi:hypothetical protein
MKKIYTLLLMIHLSNIAFSQEFKNKFFSQVAYSSFSDFCLSPLVKNEYTRSSGGDQIRIKGLQKFADVGFITLYYIPRLNLIRISEKKSISIQVPLNVSISQGFSNFYGTGVFESDPNKEPINVIQDEISIYGRVGFPIYINMNFGLASTNECINDNGFTIGLGLDNNYVLFNESSEVPRNNFFSMPSLILGYRFWRNSLAREVNLKVSSLMVNDKDALAENFLIKRGIAVSLSYGRFLNF